MANGKSEVFDPVWNQFKSDAEAGLKWVTYISISGCRPSELPQERLRDFGFFLTWRC